jgi:3-hydroxyacyl-CoA dehydrogenase/enoyl-CoA hydratase/3-hydroxybutyryl-CoA epimerase
MSNKSTNNVSAFLLDVAENGIGWLTVDVPNETQNTVKAEFAEQFEAIFDQVQNDSSINSLIIISGKDNGFIAGADISMLQNLDSEQSVIDLAKIGHDVFNRLEALNIPVVAAINGACLGAGLELALACSYRICTQHSSTKLGLPEVQLGVLPGGGGTQRLPRLVGIATSLDLMLTGKQLNGKRAKKIGLVDEVVARSNLRKAAEKAALSLTKKTKRVTSQLSPKVNFKGLLSVAEVQKSALETSRVGRKFIFDKALESVNKKTRGNYPAPEKIIKSVEAGMEQGYLAGLDVEAKLFAELVMSKEAKQLMGIFFSTTALKKDTGVSAEQSVELKDIERVGVLGGGLMGAGIAFVTADKANKKVRIKDQNHQGVNHALKYCWEIYRKRLKRKHMSINDASKRFAAITGTTSYQGFKRCDLVIEAVFENLELKQTMLKDIEEVTRGRAIFGSNTSSIPITDIASTAKYPENVIGLHYFSPVEKMPLLEIVVTEKTSPSVIASCVKFGKSQGKTVIVVKDGAGFYTSRILAPFVNEAGHLIAQGVAIDKIDNALKNAGFPVGPITLLDEVGIDVGTKIAPILADAFGQRMQPPALFEKLQQDNRKGKKNKRGFYDYSGSGKQAKKVDPTIYTLLGVTPSDEVEETEIVQRCLLQMVNESVRCLEEGILSSARDGDIGAIFGLGFPPFLGGPFRYVDAIGVEAIVAQLEGLESSCGERFKPAQLLLDMKAESKTFYSE